MNSKKICVVEDDDILRTTLCQFLENQGYDVTPFLCVSDFLRDLKKMQPYDLIVSDISMPEKTGYDLCKTIRAQPSFGRIPIILITGSGERVESLEAGADEFIQKPFLTRDLLAKVQSLLKIREQEMTTLTELKSAQGLNQKLGQLTRFVSPNVASLLTVTEENELLKPHRAEVTVLFVDLRRFTAFSERIEPAEVMEVLSTYYRSVGEAALKYNGTLGHLAGDGIMVFFNDPTPLENHREIAVDMALEAKNSLMKQREYWNKKKYNIDFGMGLSEGYGTIGSIGFDRFSQYSVIGPVSNFASRLCHVANNGQILMSHRFLSHIDDSKYHIESAGEVELKGIENPVAAFNVVSTAEQWKNKKAS